MRTHTAERHAVVTGAGSGIGRAVALALAGRGITVHAVGRRAAPLTLLAHDAPEGLIVPAFLDAGEPGALEALLQPLVGRLELVVASAGAFTRASVADMTPREWDEQLHANLTTAFHTLRAATVHMQKQNLIEGSRGQVITLNSGAGVSPFPTGAAYSAAKHGLRGLVESLRGELSGSGVKLTDLVVSATVESEMSAGRDVPKISADVVAQTVLACLDLPGIATWDRIDLGQLR